MKTHLNFATNDLEKSVEFYATLLDARPLKRRDDYALFVTERPGLELALDASDRVTPPHDVHYGVAVDAVRDVERAIERLTNAGLEATVERESTCCYANQTKVWTADPEGRRWEIYTVHAETDERDGELTECCS